LSANISKTDEDSDKSLNGVDENDPYNVEQKTCEIPSTTNKVVSADVDLP